MNWEEIIKVAAPILDAAMPYLLGIWQAFLNWWWIFLPFILWKPASFFWLFWRNELWNNRQKKTILEVRIPKTSVKPIRAMEAVFTGIWQVWAEPNWIEKWWDGQELLSFSFDIAAIDGIPHFFIRTPVSARNIVETHVYSQYPEAEIFEVEDYTKQVPQDIPNKDWIMWATDYKMLRHPAYPVKTYKEFETEREFKEEAKVDPMSALLEGMSSLKKGEQLWVQIRAKPIESEIPWVKEGKDKIEELVYRKSSPKKKTFGGKVIDFFTLTPPKKEEKKDILPPEMKLTPGEREVVAGIEKKTSKLGYKVGIRYIYLAKKEVAFKPNLRLAMSYFTNFATNNMNAMVPDGKTLTKIRKKWYDPFWFPKRRLYLRFRKSFRKYIARQPYYYPVKGDKMVLNTEELASIYHFPPRTLTPSSLVPRVEAKKGEAPFELPTEE